MDTDNEKSEENVLDNRSTEEENIIDLTEAQNITYLSSSALKSGGDSASTISTSILDDVEEAKDLRNKLKEAKELRKLLEEQIKELQINLTAERTKNTKLERKLQFVKDNQEVFMRLKEAYINMKYNEAAGRKMIEVREKGMQTWEGILCKVCIETEELRRQIENMKQTYSNSFIINCNDMFRLANTMKYLKDLIERREQSWIAGIEREQKLMDRINLAEKENDVLRGIVKDKYLGTEEKPKLENENNETVPDEREMKSEVVKLRKIIFKLEKQYRDCGNEESHHSRSMLNDKEKKIIKQIVTRHKHLKKSDRHRSRSRDNTKIKSSSLLIVQDEEERVGKATSEGDSTLMVMEHLLEDYQK